MKTKIILISVLIIFIKDVLSETKPDKADISGKVADFYNYSPIEYASVALFRKNDSSLVAGCITDKDGVFKISKIEEGNYKLEIRFIGYKTLTIDSVSVKKGSNTGELLLVPDIQALQGVEITAEKKALEYKIDKQIINASSGIAATNGSAIDVLKQSPSISVDNEDNVSLRGSSDFLLLIDNKIVIGNTSDILRQIPASQINNIEIMTNPSARYDAAGASGIINIRTKKILGNTMSGIVNARAGLRNKCNSDVIFKNKYKNLNYQISGSILNHNNYSSSHNELSSTNLDSEGIVTNDVSRKRNRFNTNIRPEVVYSLSDKTTLSGGISWMHFQFHSYINTDYNHSLNQSNNYFVSTDDFFLGANQYQGDVHLKHNFDTTGHSIDISGNYLNWQGINDQDIFQFYSTEAFEKNDLQLNKRFYEDHYMYQWEYNADYKLPFKKGITAEAGIHEDYRMFSADKLTSQLDINNNVWLTNSLYSGIHSFSENMKSAYCLMSGNIKKISIQGGLRTQYYTRITDIPEQSLYINFKKLYFFPSLHASIQGKNKSQWQLSYSRRINLPNDWFTSPVPYFNDGFIVQTGNPYLKPELFDVTELNHIRFVKQQMLSFSLYSRITHNAVERVTSKDSSGIYIISHENLTDKYYYGGEAGTTLKLGQKLNLSVFANLYAVKGFLLTSNLPYNYSEFSFSSRFSLQFKPVKNSTIELSGSYQGAEKESYGMRDPLYLFNLGIRQNLLKNKLNLILSANDIFHTYCYRYTEINENFKSTLVFRGEYPVVFLGLSYKINDFKPSHNNQQNNLPAIEL